MGINIILHFRENFTIRVTILLPPTFGPRTYNILKLIIVTMLRCLGTCKSFKAKTN